LSKHQRRRLWPRSHPIGLETERSLSLWFVNRLKIFKSEDESVWIGARIAPNHRREICPSGGERKRSVRMASQDEDCSGPMVVDKESSICTRIKTDFLFRSSVLVFAVLISQVGAHIRDWTLNCQVRFGRCGWYVQTRKLGYILHTDSISYQELWLSPISCSIRTCSDVP